jgi:hypothetical protein
MTTLIDCQELQVEIMNMYNIKKKKAILERRN